jgi:hypothetical protein
LKPLVQRNVTALEDSADFDRKRLAALIALVSTDTSALALKLANALSGASARAGRAVRPNAGLKNFVGRVLVMELWVTVDRHIKQSLSLTHKVRVGMSTPSIVSPKKGVANMATLRGSVTVSSKRPKAAIVIR